MMWATAHGGGRDATLGADDKAGVLAIYPASAGGGGPGSGGPVSITSTSVNDGVVGEYYQATLIATGGTPPYRWSLAAGGPPPGLSLSATGVIDGFPTFASSYSFAAQVLDSSNPSRIDSRSFSITIRASTLPGVPVITQVKVKGSKKLWVFGKNFQANSTVLINGAGFDPVSFAQDGSGAQLFVRGRLNLGPEGTNIIVVNTGDNKSAPYLF
jgi:hypothetical protein